ncbi:MAG: ABC transporter permease subunit [Thermoplasmata archaeon]
MRIRTALTGWYPVALKEGRSTFVSPRFIVIVAILTLAVLGGVYLISPGAMGGVGVPNRVTFTTDFFEGLNVSRPGMALFAVSPTGEPLAGVEAQLVNLTAYRGGALEVLDSKTTDSTGWVRFDGLWRDYPDHRLGLNLPDEGGLHMEVDTSYHDGDVIPNRGRLDTSLFPLSGQAGQQTLYLLFVDLEGTALDGADVYIARVPEDEAGFGYYEEDPPGGWQAYWNGTTGANGFYIRPEPLESGEYTVRVEKGELNATSGIVFFGGGPNPFRGPDGVLAFLGLQFIPLIIPLMALVLAYDAVARERSQGSLDMLLSKPVSRFGVAFGKFLGVLGSMALPVVAVVLAAAGLIWYTTGLPPTAPFLAAFMGNALLLLLVYTLIFLAVSANVKNLGTSLLISILLFLLFSFFWGLISFLIAGIMAQPGSVAWLQITVSLSLASPTGVYQQLLANALPALLGGFFGPIAGTAQALPLVWILVSAAVWAALPLLLFLLAMKYRVTES